MATWQRQSNIRVIGQDCSAHSTTNTTSETKLTSCLIPANTLKVGDVLEVDALFTMASSVNTKTWRIRYGAANDLTGTELIAPSLGTGIAGGQYCLRICVTGAAAQSFLHGAVNYSTTTNAMTGATVPINADSYVVFSVAGATGETETIEGYTVRLVPGT